MRLLVETNKGEYDKWSFKTYDCHFAADNCCNKCLISKDKCN